MEDKNIKIDNYDGYKLVNIHSYEYSIVFAVAVHNQLKFKKGLVAEYINDNGESVSIKFPSMRPNIFNKIRLKNYLKNKSFAEVLSENKEQVEFNLDLNLLNQ